MDLRRKFASYASRGDAEQRLFTLAFLEALCVPLPCDFLLIPMTTLAPDRGLRYALIAAFGSVLGGMCLFALMWFLRPLVLDYSVLMETFSAYAPVFIFAGGFSNIPFTVISLLSGAIMVSPLVFLGISILSRFFRYMFVVWLIWRSGSKYQGWLEKSFSGMTLVVTLSILISSAFVVLFFETA